ncbi:hypothetical protein QVM41_30840 [Pseudomonas shirazica]
MACELFVLSLCPHAEKRSVAYGGTRAVRTPPAIWLVTDGHESIHAKGFCCQQGWVLAGAVDERDVRYEKRRG